MNTRIFLRVLWAIFALVAPFAISYPFGLIGGSFGLLLLPQRSDGIDPEMHLLVHMHADYLFSPKGKNVCYL